MVYLSSAIKRIKKKSVAKHTINLLKMKQFTVLIMIVAAYTSAALPQQSQGFHQRIGGDLNGGERG